MGTEVDVVIEASTPPIGALLSVRLLFESQEALFSRFRPTSLLSRLNGGEAIEHAGFAAACRLALDAHDFTTGVFNPMVLPALLDAGYDRNLESVSGGRPREQQVPDPRNCLDVDGDTVRLRAGALDLGGIIKGWTVDLAIQILRDQVDGALVNAGGDLRTFGQGDRNGWQVDVASPAGGVAWTGEVDCAIATSTTLARCWLTDGQTPAHHLIDPRTGLPSSGPLAQVSVWGRETWRAECWAKGILIGGQKIARLAQADGFRVLALASDGLPLFGEGPGSQQAAISPRRWEPGISVFSDDGSLA